MIDYGTDASILLYPDGLDLTGDLMDDPYQVLIEDVYKKITCPSGTYELDENTLDMRDYLRASLSGQDINILKTRLISIFDDDLRMQVDVSVAKKTLLGKLEIYLLITPSLDETPLELKITADPFEVRIERTV